MAVKKKIKAIILAVVCVLIVAAIALSAVLIYRSTPQFALNEAGKYIDMGDYKSAIIALEEALIKFPDNADIRLALSEAYELSGDIENALRVLTEYIELYDVPENRRNELEHRIVKLGGSIDSAFGAITSGGANRNDDSGQDTDSTTASDLNNTVVYSSDNIPAELMGESPASADEVVKMINDYLQKGIEPDRNALKYVTDIQIAGDRCLWVSIKDFDMNVYSNYVADGHYDYNEETNERTVSDTVFDIIHFDPETNSSIDEDTEIVPWGTITDISFIPKYFPYLVGLDISFNRINDISPLKGMTGLRFLRMDYNEIDDISALSDMTQIQHLCLEYNNISNISALSGMTQMQSLSLENNNISDISAIAGMTALEGLRISNNHIFDLTPITGLKSLEYVYILDNTGDNYAEDTEFNLPLLKDFDLDGVLFGNVTFSNMPELEWLVIDDVSAVSVNIHDLDTVAHFYIGDYEEGVFNKIENLTISHLNSLENISTCDSMTLSNVVINDVPLLNDISFINCGLQNISIDKAPLLKDVRLRGNNLSEGKITALKEKFPAVNIYS